MLRFSRAQKEVDAKLGLAEWRNQGSVQKEFDFGPIPCVGDPNVAWETELGGKFLFVLSGMVARELMPLLLTTDLL